MSISGTDCNQTYMDCMNNGNSYDECITQQTNCCKNNLKNFKKDVNNCANLSCYSQSQFPYGGNNVASCQYYLPKS